MKNIIVLLSLIFISLKLNAQVVPRNILVQKYTLNQVQKALAPYGQYKPYPATAEQWKAAVPDSVVRAVVQAGEKQLGYTFVFHAFRQNQFHQCITFAERNIVVPFTVA